MWHTYLAHSCLNRHHSYQFQAGFHRDRFSQQDPLRNHEHCSSSDHRETSRALDRCESCYCCFQLTRDELLYGEGLPLGLVCAGIDFIKLSFFWSRELFGSLRFLLGGGWRSLFKGPRCYRKRQLAVFLLLAGVLALLAGPSCAVLLVPQVQNWPMGGTPIALNGTLDDFWPLKLSMDPVQSLTCSNLNGTLSGVCPSGGYESLWSHYHNLDNSSYRGYVRNYAFQVSGNHYYWSTGSTSPILTRTISLGWPLPTI